MTADLAHDLSPDLVARLAKPPRLPSACPTTPPSPNTSSNNWMLIKIIKSKAFLVRVSLGVGHVPRTRNINFTLKKHTNTFGVVSTVRTFYPQAESPVEVQQWVQAIQDVQEALMTASPECAADLLDPLTESPCSSFLTHTGHQREPASAFALYWDNLSASIKEEYKRKATAQVRSFSTQQAVDGEDAINVDE
ncbi:hypothetical protein DEU56DRAFT_944190 [Suillus clintonianus]|uniref:uncharacterized protein n=1 Tax=Suillus clintonianus TaxID=1904413 RepID=UPI001B88189B|nr:uncharacterized protein DEU56DRAFT_944190 [Suillus clintonianus]KAG2139290.1 hypothetical protein DEU56DRAFT_944190 [Suillus clintonianus]